MNEIDDVIYKLFSDSAKELHRLCNKEIDKFGGISNMDYDDFYSRVGMDIYLAKNSFDSSKGKTFKDYIYGVIKLSVWKEMRYRNRSKRQLIIEIEEKDVCGGVNKHKEYIKNVSIDTPIGDDENSMLGDMLADKNSVEKEIFEKKEVGYSKEMCQYLKRLSPLQRDVLHLISIGYTPNDIIGELRINKKLYDDCYNAIHSYRNISVLM